MPAIARLVELEREHLLLLEKRLVRSEGEISTAHFAAGLGCGSWMAATTMRHSPCSCRSVYVMPKRCSSSPRCLAPGAVAGDDSEILRQVALQQWRELRARVALGGSVTEHAPVLFLDGAGIGEREDGVWRDQESGRLKCRATSPASSF